MTDQPRDLADVTVEWLSALLDSASPDVIGASNWWPRATAALITAAETADTYGHAVALAAGKLQIETLTAASAKNLRKLQPHIEPRLPEWRATVQREEPYLVALCRLARSDRAAARRSAHTPTDEQEPAF